MQITRPPVEPVLPDVVIRLTYREAQLLRGIVNFFRRTARITNILGTVALYNEGYTFASALQGKMNMAGVEYPGNENSIEIR